MIPLTVFITECHVESCRGDKVAVRSIGEVVLVR